MSGNCRIRPDKEWKPSVLASTGRFSGNSSSGNCSAHKTPSQLLCHFYGFWITYSFKAHSFFHSLPCKRLSQKNPTKQQGEKHWLNWQNNHSRQRVKTSEMQPCKFFVITGSKTSSCRSQQRPDFTSATPEPGSKTSLPLRGVQASHHRSPTEPRPREPPQRVTEAEAVWKSLLGVCGRGAQPSSVNRAKLKRRIGRWGEWGGQHPHPPSREAPPRRARERPRASLGKGKERGRRGERAPHSPARLYPRLPQPPGPFPFSCRLLPSPFSLPPPLCVLRRLLSVPSISLRSRPAGGGRRRPSALTSPSPPLSCLPLRAPLAHRAPPSWPYLPPPIHMPIPPSNPSAAQVVPPHRRPPRLARLRARPSPPRPSPSPPSPHHSPRGGV